MKKLLILSLFFIGLQSALAAGTDETNKGNDLTFNIYQIQDSQFVRCYAVITPADSTSQIYISIMGDCPSGAIGSTLYTQMGAPDSNVYKGSGFVVTVGPNALVFNAEGSKGPGRTAVLVSK